MSTALNLKIPNEINKTKTQIRILYFDLVMNEKNNNKPKKIMPINKIKYKFTKKNELINTPIVKPKQDK